MVVRSGKALPDGACDGARGLPELRIRSATNADVPELLRLVNGAYAAESAALYAVPRIDENTLHELLADGELFVIQEGALLAGSVHVRRRDAVVEISTMAVAPARQGGGLGRRLLEAAEDWARERGCFQARVSVLNHRTDLLPFYTRSGYEWVGEAAFPRPDLAIVPCHFVVLSKTLDRGRP